MVALGYINEAIDEGNPLKTLDTLLLPIANIRDVDPDCAQHYQDVLFHTKSQKLLVRSRIWMFARGKTFDPFVINLMSFIPVDEDGNNKAVFLVPSIREKSRPRAITSTPPLNMQL